MGSLTNTQIVTHSHHSWLKHLNLCIVPGPLDPVLEEVLANLKAYFSKSGHHFQEVPDDDTDLILTTAKFGEPLPWRDALIFTSRKRFQLIHSPTLLTLLHVSHNDFEKALGRFEAPLRKEIPDPRDYVYPGLAPNAYKVLHEQGQRGGPILSLERVVQAQSKCLRTLLIVGDDQPELAYHFDLVGAHPVSSGKYPDEFYNDIVFRIATTMSTFEITEHEVVEPEIDQKTWATISTPREMIRSAQELGKRNFFTDMVVISDLVSVPAVTESVSSQYSEGCFVTWDPVLGALLTTITGSARPVDKGNIGEADLAVIAGVRPDGKGAQVRHIAGMENSPPSSEAVEMRGIDYELPEIDLPGTWGIEARVPVIRSKLHGHRGIASFDPTLVEFLPLPPAYYSYPVSCATEAQANGIIQAFSRSETLNNPADPRPVAFTILPGHGVVIAEKWVHGKAPFEVIWELMDHGALQVDNEIPQGFLTYLPGVDGRYNLEERPPAP
jgi:hypothetical protein